MSKKGRNAFFPVVQILPRPDAEAAFQPSGAFPVPFRSSIPFRHSLSLSFLLSRSLKLSFAPLIPLSFSPARFGRRKFSLARDLARK